MTFYNVTFLLEWCYLFLESFSFKNEKMKVILSFYGFLICQKKLPKLMLEAGNNDEEIKTSNESIEGIQKNSKKSKTKTVRKSGNLDFDKKM